MGESARFSGGSILSAIALTVAMVGSNLVVGAGPSASASPSIDRGRWTAGADALAHFDDAELVAAARLNDLPADELREMLAHDETVFLDKGGRLAFQEPLREPSELDDQPVPSGPFSNDQTFKLHSRPGSPRVLFLDFDGYTLPPVNAWLSTGYEALPYDEDGNPGSFSQTEQDVIQAMFLRISEDFAPFDIDVTTEYPGLVAIERTGLADNNYGGVLAITNSPSTDFCSGCAGVSKLGNIDFTADHMMHQPAWLFSGAKTSAGSASVGSHEVGHMIGLTHDGKGANDSYGGNGLWAPLMGLGAFAPVSQWSKGEYTGATNTQDDFVVAGSNGVGLVPDETGDGVTPPAVLEPGASKSIGVTPAGDVDSWKFTAPCSASFTFTANPAPAGANLSLELELHHFAGALVAEDATQPTTIPFNYLDAAGMGGAVTADLTAGASYAVVVRPLANLPADSGFTNYGNGGRYTITLAGPPGCAPRPNDNFADAQVLSGYRGTTTGSNVGATKQAGEPNAAGNPGGGSIWYSLTPAANGQLSIDTCGSSFDTTFGVYTGASLGALVGTASNNDSCGASSRVVFNAMAGTKYSIQVDGYNAATGNVTLNWALGIANDNFADAQVLNGYSGTAAGSNFGATKEAGEPNAAGHPGGKSIWYSFTPTGSGRLIIDTCGSSFDTTLGIYTGGSLSTLVSEASNDDYNSCFVASRVVLDATAGTKYSIQVDGRNATNGNVTLNWALGGNDNFADAQILNGNSGTTAGTNFRATKEAGEPNPAGITGSKSIWYSYTPAADGQLTIDTCGSSFDTTLGVYTGATLGALVSAASNDDSCGTRSRVTFNATAGTKYSIQVDGFNAAAGNITLNWSRTAPPNDNFADAQILNGPSGTTTGSNVGATNQALEPNAAGNVGGKSIWYSYTPAASRQLTIDTCGSSFDTTLGVYTGASVGALVSVASNNDSCGNGSRVVFNATAGTKYSIQVDGYNAANGNVTLNWALAAPPNDNFADAQVLSGYSGATTGSNVSATKQALEPNAIGNAGGKSIWYSYTPAANGPLTIDTCGSSFDTTLGVYRGASIGVLVSVASNNDSCGTASRVGFNASAGITYWIQVDGYNLATGNVTLNWSLAPPNDNFANAQVVNGNAGTTTGSNFAATKEAGEPNAAGNPGGKSIWYSHTPAVSGQLTIDTCGSSFNTTLAAYTGASLGVLASIASNNDSCGTGSRVMFNATGGMKYSIQVDGYDAASGNVTLNWSLTAPNDDFADAEVLNGNSGTTSGANFAATKEAGEPNAAGNPGGKSIWYSYTPAASGQLTIDTCGSSFDTILGVYTGVSVGALASVASNDESCGHSSRVVFNATGGTKYSIQVDGYSAAWGNVTLNWALAATPGPANDNFANAQGVTGSTGTTTGTNVNATKEAGEPNAAGNPGGKSIWYSFTPASNGQLTIDTCGSSFDTTLAVYSGGTLATLVLVEGNDQACGTSSRVVFNATAGTTYRIQIDGYNAASGNVTFNWALTPPPGPANDNFENAHVLAGQVGTLNADTTLATEEASEPNPNGNPGGKSIWYSYTPSTTSTLVIDTCNSSFDTLINVYTGTTLVSLLSIASNDDGCGTRQSIVSLPVTAGTTYSIQVDGYNNGTGAESGSLTLTWLLGKRVVIPWSTEDAARVQEMATHLGTTPEQLQHDGVAFLAFLVNLSGDPTPSPWTDGPPSGTDTNYGATWTADDLPLLDTAKAKYVVDDIDAHRLAMYFISFLLALGGN